MIDYAQHKITFYMLNKQGPFVTGVLSAASETIRDLSLEVIHEAANDTLI